jgi:hypothetical protein
VLLIRTIAFKTNQCIKFWISEYRDGNTPKLNDIIVHVAQASILHLLVVLTQKMTKARALTSVWLAVLLEVAAQQIKHVILLQLEVEN